MKGCIYDNLTGAEAWRIKLLRCFFTPRLSPNAIGVGERFARGYFFERQWMVIAASAAYGTVLAFKIRGP